MKIAVDVDAIAVLQALAYMRGLVDPDVLPAALALLAEELAEAVNSILEDTA